MKKVNKHRIYMYSLVILSVLLITSCGNNKEINQELEGMEYLTMPEFEPDSNLYPLYFRASSTKIPYEKYAAENALDGDLNTYWETVPGNITGEFLEWVWENQYVSSFNIVFSNQIYHAQVNSYNVYLNDTLIGTFSANQKVFLNRYTQKIRIEINETPGINSAAIPSNVDSLSTTEITLQNIISTYSSKSAAIAEIMFFDKENKKIPFKNIPKVKAFVNCISTQTPKEFYSLELLFDGNLNTEWQSISSPHTILFSFPEEQMITKVIFPLQTENETNIQSFSMGLRNRKLPIYFIDEKERNIEVPLTKAMKGKNFELSINSTLNKLFPTIAEIIFFDGSKPFVVHTDSSEFYQNQLKDSIVNTSLEKLVDNRQRYVKEWNVYPKNLMDIKEANEPFVPKENHKIDIVFHLRSNRTAYISESRADFNSDNKKNPYSYTKQTFDGLWRVITKSKEASELELKGMIKSYKSDNGFTYELIKTEKINLRVTLNNNSILHSEHFSSLIISW